MKCFVMTAMLLSTGVAFAGDMDDAHQPGDGHKPQHPRPACIHGERAADVFNSLDVEAKVFTKGELTVTVKRTKGLFCQEIASDKGERYRCCLRQGDKKPDPKSDDFNESQFQL